MGLTVLAPAGANLAKPVQPLLSFTAVDQPTDTDSTPGRSSIAREIAQSAREQNIDPAFVESVMMAESGFRADAVSPSGALGLMQVMPETAEEMGYDAAVWQENIAAGAAYLRVLLQRYGNMRLALAAYNAGPGNVDRYRGVPPFRETQTYVRRVLAQYRTLRRVGAVRTHRPARAIPRLLTD